MAALSTKNLSSHAVLKNENKGYIRTVNFQSLLGKNPDVLGGIE